MSSWSWTLIFAAALVASLVLRAWLASRQVRHVARHRETVPEPFRATVDLAAHRKAASYTLAKIRLGQWQMVFGAVVLLGWTLFGGLAALDSVLRDEIAPRWGGLAHEVALVAAVLTINLLVWIPLILWLRRKAIAQATAFRAELEATGLQVLYDERDAGPGEKFADAELLGCPLRLTVGRRTLGSGEIEVQVRRGRESRAVSIPSAAQAVAELWHDLP